METRSGDAAAVEYRTVQGLVRGLELLMALNRMPGASASATQLGAATGLHRTTAKRLLETLRTAGFVHHGEGGFGYSLAQRVCQLSEGWRPQIGLCDVARPLLHQLTQQLLWPCSLLMREGERLVVRESTHHVSPLSFHTGVMGAHIPLARTAAGRAYLAFCGDTERELLLAMLRSRDDGEGKAARDQCGLLHGLETTRRNGYALNEGNDWIGQGRYGAIAVPVRRGGAVAGCLDMVFSKRAVPIQLAVSKYAPELLAVAAKLEVAQLQEA